MSTLHLFSAACVSDLAKHIVKQEDSILLSQDACYVANQFIDFAGRKYILASCAQARGIESIVGFSMISDEEFVTLVLNHHSNVSW